MAVCTQARAPNVSSLAQCRLNAYVCLFPSMACSLYTLPVHLVGGPHNKVIYRQLRTSLMAAAQTQTQVARSVASKTQQRNITQHSNGSWPPVGRACLRGSTPRRGHLGKWEMGGMSERGAWTASTTSSPPPVSCCHVFSFYRMLSSAHLSGKHGSGSGGKFWSQAPATLFLVLFR